MDKDIPLVYYDDQDKRIVIGTAELTYDDLVENIVLSATVTHENFKKIIMSSARPGDYSIADVASKEIETHTNEKGGSQSRIPVRFDLVDGKAMFAMTAVLHEGAEKYGENNWRLIDVPDHLNHLIMHAYAWLSGDRTDDHLSHALCRAMFAQGVDLQEEA